MDSWNVVWLVIVFGLTVVAPVILLAVSVRGLGANVLSEKQQRVGEEALRKAGIVREGETWEARDLDELMLNMRQYDQWQKIGVAATLLVTGGAGNIALVMVARGFGHSSIYTVSFAAISWSSLMLGGSAGHFVGDRRFVNRVGTLPGAQPGAIFSGEVLRRPRWLRWLDGGLIVSVSFFTLLYTLGMGGTLESPATGAVVASHPWLIWSTPVASCVTMVAQELLVRWEMRRPPLQLTEQPELARRADLHERRAACKTIYSLGAFQQIAWLSIFQLTTFSGLALSPFALPLSLAAFGALIAGVFAYVLADSRRTRQARIAGDGGLHGEGGVV